MYVSREKGKKFYFTYTKYRWEAAPLVGWALAEPISTIQVVQLVMAPGTGLVSSPNILSNNIRSLGEHVQSMDGNTAVLVIDDVLEDRAHHVPDVVGQELAQRANDTATTGSISIGADHGVTGVLTDHLVETGQILGVDQFNKLTIKLEDNLEGLLLVTAWLARWSNALLLLPDSLNLRNGLLQKGNITMGQDHDFIILIVLDEDILKNHGSLRVLQGSLQLNISLGSSTPTSTWTVGTMTGLGWLRGWLGAGTATAIRGRTGWLGLATRLQEWCRNRNPSPMTA